MILGSPNSMSTALASAGKPMRKSFFGGTRMGWRAQNMGLPMRTGYSAAAPVTGGLDNPMAFPGYNPGSGTSPVGNAMLQGAGVGSQYGAQGLMQQLQRIGVGGPMGPGGSYFYAGGGY